MSANWAFVIAAKSNKKIKGILEKHTKESGNTSTVFEYKFDGEEQTFNIVAIWGRNYERAEKFLLLITTDNFAILSTELSEILVWIRK